MSALLMFTMSISSVLMFPLMSQPLSLGLMIMISTLLMCSVSAMTLSSWYGYILFLIYVGGLLVMFAYVAALSPNVLFGSGLPLIFFTLMALLIGVFMFTHFLVDFPMMTYSNEQSTLKFMKTYGTEMVSPQMISILIGLALILLVNLVVVVKICYYQHASLRPFKE
uniref:NADH dehydrogenase subunit 6 n=1 Tax=Distorsio anus TaxID=2945631 RepID=A0A9E7V684_9CAEN|nr:NADH dehydrogenase subunit 6 [Distorsio anus]